MELTRWLCLLLLFTVVAAAVNDTEVTLQLMNTARGLWKSRSFASKFASKLLRVVDLFELGTASVLSSFVNRLLFTLDHFIPYFSTVMAAVYGPDFRLNQDYKEYNQMYMSESQIVDHNHLMNQYYNNYKGNYDSYLYDGKISFNPNYAPYGSLSDFTNVEMRKLVNHYLPSGKDYGDPHNSAELLKGVMGILGHLRTLKGVSQYFTAVGDALPIASKGPTIANERPTDAYNIVNALLTVTGAGSPDATYPVYHTDEDAVHGLPVSGSGADYHAYSQPLETNVLHSHDFQTPQHSYHSSYLSENEPVQSEFKQIPLEAYYDKDTSRQQSLHQYDQNSYLQFSQKPQSNLDLDNNLQKKQADSYTQYLINEPYVEADKIVTEFEESQPSSIFYSEHILPSADSQHQLKKKVLDGSPKGDLRSNSSSSNKYPAVEERHQTAKDDVLRDDFRSPPPLERIIRSVNPSNDEAKDKSACPNNVAEFALCLCDITFDTIITGSIRMFSGWFLS